MFTGDRRKMGEFVNPVWLQALGWAAAAAIAGLNGWLLLVAFRGTST
jgi:manganese transport protein